MAILRIFCNTEYWTEMEAKESYLKYMVQKIKIEGGYWGRDFIYYNNNCIK